MHPGPITRILVPLTCLILLWLIFYAALGHAGSVLAAIAFVTLILIPNRLHGRNGAGR